LLTPSKVDDPLASDADEPFIPPKVWTAWPLASDKVPRSNEKVGEEDPDEVYTIKRREKEYPSRELEDILTGITLRSAKERLEARETVSEFVVKSKTPVENDSDTVSEDQGYAEDNVDDDQNDDLDNESKPEAQAIVVPTISLDDEETGELVRPSIRHTLAKVNGLLTALHHARANCWRFSPLTEADGSENLIATGDEVLSERRPKGRPRNFENLTYRSKVGDGPGMDEEEVGDEERLTRKRSRGAGRPPKQYPRLDGETDREYLVRIARLQKKPLPVFAPPLPVNEPENHEPPSRNPSLPRVRKYSLEAATKRAQKLELRDWSEVLGTAALVGFSPEIIAKATQRCVNLFGEGMVMRTLIEAPFGVGDTSHETVYQPEEIPDFSSALAIHRLPDPERDTGSPESEGTSNDAADFEDPSDREMDGAVHVDRFLKPAKRLWRGPDKKKRKRKMRSLNSASKDDGQQSGERSDLDEAQDGE
jgi:hypothetical protein